MKIARKRATRHEILREPGPAVANYCNSGTKLSAIFRRYKRDADLLDDQKNVLLDRESRRLEELFSALDEGHSCNKDECIRDETTTAPIDPTIFVDHR